MRDETDPYKAPQSGPWSFFMMTFVISWLFWIPAAWSGQDVMTFPVVLLLILGGLGPPLAAIILTHAREDREVPRDYWRRVVDLRRIGVGWLIVVLLICPLRSLLAIPVEIIMGGNLPSFETTREFLSRPLMILPFALFTLVYGPLPEETS